MRLLASWLRLPSDERRLALEAATLIAFIRVSLKVFPLGMLRRWLHRSAEFWRVPSPEEEDYRERAARAAERAGRRLLGDRACLAQSLAVEWLYRRRGIPAEVCIGVARSEDGGLVAHAWVESEGRVMAGGPPEALAGYTRLPALDGKLP